MTATAREEFAVGQMVPGYAAPVANEHQVRAGAAILLIGGAIAYGFSLAHWNPALMKPFGFVFMWDMFARTSLGEKYSPSPLLAGHLVRNRAPYWVGAKAKTFAWYLGLGMALTACFTMGWVAVPEWVTLAICGCASRSSYSKQSSGSAWAAACRRSSRATLPSTAPGATARSPTTITPRSALEELRRHLFII